MKKFKIRASAVSQIMGKLSGGLTETQAKNLATLESKEKRTAKQEETYKDLLIKKETPKILPKTCVSYLEQWVKEQVFDYRTELKSDYLDKGNMCEDEAIAMTIKEFNLPYNEKNELYFENEYLTGTPDVIYQDEIIDTKCSFTPDTFPVFIDKPMREHNINYWWQGQSYMELCSVNNYRVSYCLCNTPQEILDKILYHGLKGLSAEARERKQQEIINRHNFDNVPIEMKVKGFPFVRDPEAIKAVYQRVEMCRQYIETELKPKLNKGNK